jgi:hypothetical protein
MEKGLSNLESVLLIRKGPYIHSLMHNATSIYQLQQRRIRKSGLWSPTAGNKDMDSKLLRRTAEGSVRDVVGGYTGGW